MASSTPAGMTSSPSRASFIASSIFLSASSARTRNVRTTSSVVRYVRPSTNVVCVLSMSATSASYSSAARAKSFARRETTRACLASMVPSRSFEVGAASRSSRANSLRPSSMSPRWYRSSTKPDRAASFAKPIRWDASTSRFPSFSSPAAAAALPHRYTASGEVEILRNACSYTLAASFGRPRSIRKSPYFSGADSGSAILLGCSTAFLKNSSALSSRPYLRHASASGPYKARSRPPVSSSSFRLTSSSPSSGFGLVPAAAAALIPRSMSASAFFLSSAPSIKSRTVASAVLDVLLRPVLAEDAPPRLGLQPAVAAEQRRQEVGHVGAGLAVVRRSPSGRGRRSRTPSRAPRPRPTSPRPAGTPRPRSAPWPNRRASA